VYHAGQIKGTPRSFLLVDQIELIPANFVGAKFFGRFAKELAEFADVVGVSIDGGWSQVPDLHVLGHATDVRIELSVVGRHGGHLDTEFGAPKPTLGFAVDYSNMGRKRAKRKWKLENFSIARKKEGEDARPT
jgi:hypothetical protein